MNKTVFEEIAETMEEDRKRDEEFTLKIRALVKEYYPFNTGHEITITYPNKEQLYVEDIIKTFVPKDKNDKIVKYEVLISKNF